MKKLTTPSRVEVPDRTPVTVAKLIMGPHLNAVFRCCSKRRQHFALYVVRCFYWHLNCMVPDCEIKSFNAFICNLIKFIKRLFIYCEKRL